MEKNVGWILMGDGRGILVGEEDPDTDIQVRRQEGMTDRTLEGL